MLPCFDQTAFAARRIDVTYVAAEFGAVRYSVQFIAPNGDMRLRRCKKDGIGVDLRRNGVTVNLNWPTLRVFDAPQ